jgi:hypothetical protein
LRTKTLSSLPQKTRMAVCSTKVGVVWFAQERPHFAPPVQMIKLTETREITAYRWVHPDEER